MRPLCEAIQVRPKECESFRGDHLHGFEDIGGVLGGEALAAVGQPAGVVVEAGCIRQQDGGPLLDRRPDRLRRGGRAGAGADQACFVTLTGR